MNKSWWSNVNSPGGWGGKLLAVLLLAALLSLALPGESQAVFFNRKISGSIPDSGDVPDRNSAEAAFSPDGRYVVFVADRDTDEMFELYSVRREGGEPVKLNPPLVNGGNVTLFQISPDSQYVVYSADQEKDNVVELFSVPIGGGESLRLNNPLTLGSNVDDYFKITPNSLGVVY